MKISDFIWDEIVHGGHWGSLSTVAVALSTVLLLDVPLKPEFIFIVYFGTLSIYTYNHLAEMEIDRITNPQRVTHLEKYASIAPWLVFSYVGIFSFLLLIKGNIHSIIIGFILLILGLSFNRLGKRLTKKIIGFKTIYTALSWSFLIIFTTVYHLDCIPPCTLFLVIFSFLRFVIGTSYCDLKDLDSDKSIGILTLPAVLGKEKFLSFLSSVNLLSLFPLLAAIYLGYLPVFSFILVYHFFYSFYYIVKARYTSDVARLCYVMVDGEFVPWPLLLLIGKVLTA